MLYDEIQQIELVNYELCRLKNKNRKEEKYEHMRDLIKRNPNVVRENIEYCELLPSLFLDILNNKPITNNRREAILDELFDYMEDDIAEEISEEIFYERKGA